jgi:hypothetical protein
MSIQPNQLRDETKDNPKACKQLAFLIANLPLSAPAIALYFHL